MKTKASREDGSAQAAPKRYRTESLISRDGTTISYRQIGHGPGLLLLHGGMSSAHNHMEMAEALSDAFTIYVPDRRGRCDSGPFGVDYCMRKEVEDVEALLTRTGAHYTFGVSSGALILLEALLSHSCIRKAAVFEPPIFSDASVPAAVLARLDNEMEQGNIAAALITAMKGARMGPAALRMVPRGLLKILVKLAMKIEDRQTQGAYVPMRSLAATLHYDSQLVVEMSGDVERFRAIQAEVLLLGGSKSPAYLKAALDGLERVISPFKRIEFRGLDHAASWNSDRGGKPEPVVGALRQFFM